MPLNNNDPIAVGKRIKKLREDHKEQQKDLAKKLGVSEIMMNYWEAGTRPIKSDFITALADRYAVTCDYILRGIEPDNITASNDFGLDNDAIEVLKLAASILKKHNGKDDLKDFSFPILDKDDKIIEVKDEESVMHYAKNTIDCLNILLKQLRSHDSLRTIDYIMNYINADIDENDAFDLVSVYDESTTKQTMISGADILAAKLLNVQQSLKELKQI